VNAIVMDYFEAALSGAKGAERAYSNGCARPLEGLPVAVKDEHNIAGTRTTNERLSVRCLRYSRAVVPDPYEQRRLPYQDRSA
jgi:hypothetical protein